MNKEEMLAYWNYSRIIKTIPEKRFETDPQIKQLAEIYMILEGKFFKKMEEVNSAVDNKKKI